MDSMQSGLIKTLKRNFVLVIVGQILSYAITILIANHLSKALFGDYAIFLKSVVILSAVLSFGFVATAKRYIPIYHEGGKLSHIKGMVRRFFSLYAAYVILIVLVSLAALFFLALQNFDFTLFAKLHPAMFAIYIAPVVATSLLLTGVLNSYKLSEQSYFTNVVVKNLVQLAMVVLIIVLGYISVNLLVVIFLLAAVTNILFQLWYVFKIDTFKTVMKSLPAYEAEWFNYAFTNMLNAVIPLALGLVSLFMMEIFGKFEGDVGDFAVLMSITALLTIYPLMIRSVFPAYISSYNVDHDANRLVSLNRLALGSTFFVNAALALLMIVFSAHLLALYHPHYQGLGLDLIIMVVAMFVNSLLGPTRNMLIYLGFHAEVVKMYFLNLVLLVALNAVLIPMYHLRGVVVALVIAKLFVIIYSYSLGVLNLPIKPLEIREKHEV